MNKKQKTHLFKKEKKEKKNPKLKSCVCCICYKCPRRNDAADQ